MRSPVEVARLMAAYSVSPEAQESQTEFRTRIAAAWGIQPGDRILEIGCGQGDMTAVLAEVVGESGHILAVDAAEPNYGAPVTLGDSTKHLAEGPLGGRIKFRLEHDLASASFEPDSFDAVVMAHCTWYFDSIDRLRDTFQRLRPWAKRLLLSEWNLEPRSLDQMGHWLAVFIQGQIEAHREASQANVRTPYARAVLLDLLSATGWQVASQELIDASALDDGKWEVDACFSAADLLDEIKMPSRLTDLLRSQVSILNEVTDKNLLRALDSYAITANRQEPS